MRGRLPAHTTLINSACARILLSVLRTLLHGAFQWLQPRGPVAQKAVEGKRGPDPPDGRVQAPGSARGEAPAVRANRRVVAQGSHLHVAKAHAKPLRGGRAVVPPPAKEDGRVAEAVAVLVVDR